MKVSGIIYDRRLRPLHRRRREVDFTLGRGGQDRPHQDEMVSLDKSRREHGREARENRSNTREQHSIVAWISLGDGEVEERWRAGSCGDSFGPAARWGGGGRGLRKERGPRSQYEKVMFIRADHPRPRRILTKIDMAGDGVFRCSRSGSPPSSRGLPPNQRATPNPSSRDPPCL